MTSTGLMCPTVITDSIHGYRVGVSALRHVGFLFCVCVVTDKKLIGLKKSRYPLKFDTIPALVETIGERERGRGGGGICSTYGFFRNRVYSGMPMAHSRIKTPALTATGITQLGIEDFVAGCTEHMLSQSGLSKQP